jgi:replicative DNA helicase
MKHKIVEALQKAGVHNMPEDMVDTINYLVKDYADEGYEKKKSDLLEILQTFQDKLFCDNLLTIDDVNNIVKTVKNFAVGKKRQGLRDSDLLINFKAPATKFYLDKLRELQLATWGMQAGFYLISGDSQVGKTALLINLAMNILNHNQNSKVYFFSLDDRILKFKERLVSCQSYFESKDINCAVDSDYSFYECTSEDITGESQTSTPIALNRQKAIDKIKLWNNKRLFLYDGKYDTSTFEMELDDVDRENGIIIIDAVYRIKTAGKDKNEKEENLVCWVKDLSNELMMPVVAVKDVRKSSKRGETTVDNKRIRGGYSSDDMRGSILWDYEADVIMMLSELEQSPKAYASLINMKIDKNKIRGMKSRKDLELYWKKTVYMEA